MEKRSFRRGTMNEKREKEAFVGVRWTKNGKRRLSATGETQKSAKIGFPPRGKTRNRRKTAFPHGGKSKNDENRLSQHWENKKSAKIDFPNIGKTRNRRKTVFPTLGRIKNTIGCISQLSRKDEKTRKSFIWLSGFGSFWHILLPAPARERPILLEIIEDRHERKSTIITSQYPSPNWYDMVGDPTIADAILDRIIHTAHTIELYGESMRKLRAKKSQSI